MSIEPTEQMLGALRERIKPYLKERRYAHTLSVEGEAAYMARHLLPEREGSLRAASLLHDIAKKLSYEKQLNYIREFGIMEADRTPVGDVAHAPAGAALVIRDFPEYAADAEIVSAVKYHATGHAEMTVFEAIVFLADYIEPTRPYESCRALREFFHSGIETAKTDEEKLSVLRESVMTSLRETIAHVRSNNFELDPETVTALSYFESGGRLIMKT